MKEKDSKFCWFLAFALSWTNMTNGWIWITYASISDFTSQFYDANLSQINWISLLFGIIMSVFGFFLIWFIDRYGIKVTLITAASLNCLCSLLRSISSAPFVPLNFRYPVLIISSIVAGFSQPLSLFSSTKLAATWFTPRVRISANTFASMGNPLGVILANLLSAIIVKQKLDIPKLNNIYLSISAANVFIVVVSVYLAPNFRNESLLIKQLSFVQQFKTCVTNIQFCILNACFSINVGIFTTYSTLIQQILCPFGYTDTFSGICGALLLALGFPGVFFSGFLVSKFSALTETTKFFMIFTSLGMIMFSIVSNLSHQSILIVFSVSVMGFFGFGVYPSFLELAAETAYPAGEVISSGFLILTSQIFGLIAIPVAQEIAEPSKSLSHLSVCAVEEIKSYWIPNLVLASLHVAGASVLMLAFKTKYKRTDEIKSQITSSISLLSSKEA